MENPRQVVSGIVLRETETKESDKILTVLTPELGKISVIARGCRKKTSKFSAASQLFAFSEMTLYEHKNWYYLEEANTKELFDGLRQDIEKLALAAFFADIVDEVCPDGAIMPEVMPLLLNGLYALSTLQKDIHLIKMAFTWKLLSYAGFEPFVDGCAICGVEEPEIPMLDIQEGILHCKECKEGTTISLPLTNASVEVLRYILFGDVKRLYSIKMDKQSLDTLDHASEAYLMVQMERKFKTLDYFKSFSPEVNS